jgi:hypothetical protein
MHQGRWILQFYGDGGGGALVHGGRTGHPCRRHIGLGQTRLDASTSLLGFSPGE